jgi:mRNA interferase HigB
VHVISRKALREFWRKHPQAEMPLRAWYTRATQGSFGSYAELKRSFPAVDMVSLRRGVVTARLYVFDIAGNKYRLIAAIHFNVQRLFVRHVLTHADYDHGGWKR